MCLPGVLGWSQHQKYNPCLLVLQAPFPGSSALPVFIFSSLSGVVKASGLEISQLSPPPLLPLSFLRQEDQGGQDIQLPLQQWAKEGIRKIIVPERTEQGNDRN
ncbi:hypothetical protein U0070_009596, partial [Myodes glareolus]